MRIDALVGAEAESLQCWLLKTQKAQKTAYAANGNIACELQCGFAACTGARCVREA